MSKAVILTLFFLLVALIILFLVFYRTNKGEGFSNFQRPPSLKRKIRVYVSSPLFNMSDLFYSVGINGLTSTSSASIASDNVKFPGIARYADIFASTMGIPRGGMAQYLAERGWEAYIPARDGFNMAVYAGVTTAFLPGILSAGDADSKALKDAGVTQQDAAFAGAYLLMAVYAFDMFNLVSRCNCFIFNSSGITMDDGSVAELGIASARGLLISIHSPEDVTLFAGGIINPMVAGAASIDLRSEKWKFYTIKDVVNDMKEKIIKFREKGGPEYWRVTRPPDNIMFWNTLGSKIWNYKFKNHVVDQDGVTDLDQSMNDDFRIKDSNDMGRAFIGGHIIGLIKQTQKDFDLPLLTDS